MYRIKALIENIGKSIGIDINYIGAREFSGRNSNNQIVIEIEEENLDKEYEFKINLERTLDKYTVVIHNLSLTGKSIEARRKRFSAGLNESKENNKEFKTEQISLL